MVLSPDMFQEPNVNRAKLKNVLLGIVDKIFDIRARDHHFLTNYPRLSDNIAYQYSTPEASFTDSLNRALHYAQAGITELTRAEILLRYAIGSPNSLSEKADELGVRAGTFYAKCFEYYNIASGKGPKENIEIPERQLHPVGD